MKVGSLFSGIGGIDAAFERAGARIVFNCEIDAKCRSVLAHHWPGVPRFKDIRSVTGSGLRAAGLAPDVLVGGFPCTDVSVAGRRAGLAGEQSGLFFEFARLLDELRPAWALIENVPGLLSSHRGADMGTVIGHLVDLGYGVAWRVLDAQWFGVAQRRRRVFIVGCLGDRARAAEVLLEPEGRGGDPPARHGQGPVPPAGSGGRPEINGGIPVLSNALCSNRGQRNDHNEQTFIPVYGRVRRLTPTEGLRLQGLPGNWLDGLGLVESRRYEMIGNSVAVPVVEWIAGRMVKIDGQP